MRVPRREAKHDMEGTLDSTVLLAPPEDFSLVLGGPLYQLWRRLHLAGSELELLVRRMIGIPLVAWLPLLALTAYKGLAIGTAVPLPFLYDLEVHVRLLVAIPLFLLAEVIVHRRIRAVVPQFVDAGLVTPEVLPGFQAAIDRAMRLRNSLAVELILAVGVFGFGWLLWHETMSLGISTWYSSLDPAGGRLTLAGQWYVHVSVPISQFYLYRWYFRLFVWALLLWRFSRLDLRLTPTHPDQAGGLGFLADVPSAFALLILAQGALLSGSIGNRILLEGATLDAFRYEIAAFVILQLLVMLGPLAVFSPTLLALKRRGRREYSALAARYTREFHAKWIGGTASPDEPLVGSGDIQSLADLANSFAVVQGMRAIPCRRDTVILVALAALVPLAPLVLTMVPTAEILKQLLVMLL